jgi:two-component system, LytTR family, response regulator
VIKALIIDDEPSAVNTLRLMLERYVPEIKELKSTNDAQEGLQLINTFKPQLLFLDIQMPMMTGFELLKQVPEINFNIIFTTAHDKYAIDAIRFSALDYLLKPIDADELRAAADKFIIRETLLLHNKSLYNNLLHNISTPDKKDFRMALPTSKETIFCRPAEIIRLEGESNYTRFFFTDKKTLVTSRTLKEYEEILLTHGFIRVHKSHLVNKTYVTNYTADGMLTMTDNSKVEISRRRKEEVITQLKAN